jgi:uncharacterized protein YdeI (YjbR/CyaY-like superfamily)
MNSNFSKLKREHYPMPEMVGEAINDKGLMEKYHSRPAYQQNDYIGWIMRAKRPETRQKRIQQMLDELEKGDLYMKMDYHPRK